MSIRTSKIRKVAKHNLACVSSVVVRRCQVCDYAHLEPILFLGYLPPVNKMISIEELPSEQPSYPALILSCPRCRLVQLGLIIDPQVLFPPEYPYTSGTTKILRENFAELYKESRTIVNLNSEDLVVDIGSNDGTLLSNFSSQHRVWGITPENIGKIALRRGIPTKISYFDQEVVSQILTQDGQAKIVTATNVFAHMRNIHKVLKQILRLLKQDGVFISESHYLPALVKTLQYDTIYHEHLRYYSLSSLSYLLMMHGLEIIHAKYIPTHGGSIRVYAARKNSYKIRNSVPSILEEEKKNPFNREKMEWFRKQVVMTKLKLYSLLQSIKKSGKRVYGIGAPSRASTLINYIGIDDGIIDYVLEVKGSHKIGKYIPGTLIPIAEESLIFKNSPEYALVFSWHIAEELMAKLKQKGFRGDFIIPLPNPRIVKNISID
jgi:2-polyprenyl-3-methyl-5-hydroxy-6-metoxy-1,4-benzoquinol methylase